MKTAKLDEQMKRSIIDKRCAETALIEAKTKLIQLEIENATKAQKTPTESIPTVNHEQLNTVLIEANKELMEENGEYAIALTIKEDRIGDLQDTVNELYYRIKMNRFWFISIAGILSGILLFMIHNYVH